MKYTNLGAEYDQSHNGDHPEDEGDLAVGLEPLAEPDEDGHPDDDHVEQRLEKGGRTMCYVEQAIRDDIKILW